MKAHKLDRHKADLKLKLYNRNQLLQLNPVQNSQLGMEKLSIHAINIIQLTFLYQQILY